jgi:adenylyltransferase/sulfurtransferase
MLSFANGPGWQLPNALTEVIEYRKTYLIEAAHFMQEITASELKVRLDAGHDIQLIDVRQPDEYAFARIEGARLIPLGEIIRRKDEIDAARETVVHCKMGGRSAQAIELLQKTGFSGELKNLVGGITAWSNDVDPTVPKY